MSDIDHEYTNEIVCPHCGCESSDSWESRDEGEEDCPECGKIYAYSRHVEVTYCTEKIEPKTKP